MQTSNSDLITIAKGAGLGIIGSIAGSGLRYLFDIILARNLGPELFGLFFLGFAVFRISTMVAEHGLSNGVVRYVAIFSGEKDFGRVKGIILAATKLAVFSSLAVSLIVIVFSSQIALYVFRNRELTSVLILFSLAIPFTTITTIFLFAAQGFKIVRSKIIVREFFEPSARIIMVAIIFLYQIQLHGAIFAYCVPTVFGTLIAFYYLYKIFPQLTKIELQPISETKELLAFSRPLFIVQFLFVFMLWIDTVMVGIFLSSNHVGVYSASQRTALFLSIIASSFASIYAPIISDLYNRKQIVLLTESFKTAAKWMFTACLPFFLILVFFARPILGVFGNGFEQGEGCLILLSIGWIILSSVGSSGQILIMTGRQKLHLAHLTIVLVINVLLNILLIPKMGILGAALATTAAITLFSLITVIQVYRLLKIHPYRKDFYKPVIAGAVALFVLYIASRIMTNMMSIPYLFLGAGIFFCIYIAVLFMLGLQDEDRVVITKIMNKVSLNKKP